MFTVMGAGVHVDLFSSATLERCTIASNRVVDAFPGINHGGVSGAASLVDCIVGGNDQQELDTRSSARYSDIEGGFPGAGNINLDPLFAGAGSLDYHLLAGSPCIDAGDPASALDPDGTRADMGGLPYLRAAVFARTGSGINRPCFTVLSPPVVGSTFLLRIDASLHPGALVSGFIGVDAPLSPGVVYPFGELLIDVFGGQRLVQGSRASSGFLDDLAVPIPADPGLIGLVGYLQAYIAGGGVELCNGLDVLLGN